ncbi:MAG TPA: GNAT family N-acetyltransferase [Actinoplanes sp.]|nr:GNAT family N-acetyltransferase [Actinoplanes sp.]
MSERTQIGSPVASAEVDGWSVETRRTDDGLAGLGPEWDDLFARCAAATPFQSHAWLESWWRTYGTPGRLRLVLVRHGDRLVAAAPLMLCRRTVLTPLGGAFSDFTDVLVDDTMSAQATRVLAETLIRQPGWQAIDFPETRPGAVAGAALWDAWPGGRRETPGSLCFELAAMPMEDLVGDLPAHSRKTVRRRLNQLKRADLDIREVTAGDADRAVADLLRLHALQWQGRGGNRQHLTPAFAEHLTGAIRGMLGSGQAALLEYRFAGRLMASSLVLIGRDLVGGYLYGADPALRERVDVTTMLLADALPMAYRLGRPTMSMLRGAEEHKLRWRPRESQNRRILLARPGSARGTAYAIGVRALRGAVLTAKEKAPWLRTVRDRVRRSR